MQSDVAKSRKAATTLYKILQLILFMKARLSFLKSYCIIFPVII